MTVVLMVRLFPGRTAKIPRALILLAAFRTDAVYLELVGFHPETELRRDCILQPFNSLVLELLDGAAAGTHQVIMVFPFTGMLVAALPISEMYLSGNAAFGEELQGPIHGSISDGRIFRPYFQIQIFGAHVLVRGKKNVENYISLTGRFQSFPGNKLMELPLLGALHRHTSVENDYHHTYLRA